MDKKKYYISTAIAYTSGKPHIGNTYEIVLADAIARYKRLKGYDVYLQTGTDEHGQKIELKAKEAQEEESVDEDEEEVKEEVSQNEDTEISEVNKTSEDNNSDIRSEESVQTSPEVKIQEEHIAEVKQIVDKNPRITLWSSRSSAVFRYLRKTEPEFSISKEASVLIEEAVAKKYPEIWALFDDY